MPTRRLRRHPAATTATKPQTRTTQTRKNSSPARPLTRPTTRNAPFSARPQRPLVQQPSRTGHPTHENAAENHRRIPHRSGRHRILPRQILPQHHLQKRHPPMRRHRQSSGRKSLATENSAKEIVNKEPGGLSSYNGLSFDGKIRGYENGHENGDRIYPIFSFKEFEINPDSKSAVIVPPNDFMAPTIILHMPESSSSDLLRIEILSF